jgi:hypothetical protein
MPQRGQNRRRRPGQNDQRAKLKADCRGFAKEFLLYSSKLTKAPNFLLELTTTPGRLKIKISDPDTGKSAMPYGYNGAVVYYDVLDEPPANPKQLTRSELASSSTHYLDFSPEEEGRRAYVSLQSSIIP